MRKPEEVIIPVSASDRHLESQNKIEQGYLVVKIKPDEVCVTGIILLKTQQTDAQHIDRARQASVVASAKLCLTRDE